MCMDIVKLLLVKWTRKKKKLAITRAHLNTHMHPITVLE